MLLMRQETLDTPLKDIFDAIRNGSLAAYQSGEDNRLDTLCFVSSEVDALILKLVSHKTGAEVCRKEDVMSELGVGKRAAAFLVSSGRIRLLGVKARTMLISRKSLDQFKTEWAKLGDIAAEANSNRMLVRKALEAAGVESFRAGEPEDSDATTFFRRSAVGSVDLAAATLKVAVHKGRVWSDYDRGLKERSAAKSDGPVRRDS